MNNSNKENTVFDTYWNSSNAEGLQCILDFVNSIRGTIEEDDEEKEEVNSASESDGPYFDINKALNRKPDDYDYRSAPKGVYGMNSKPSYFLCVIGAYDKKGRLPELIYKQGQAYTNFKGTCGLCSTANAIRLLKVDSPTEAEVVQYAADNGFCEFVDNDDPDQAYYNGGTTGDDRVAIAEHYGLLAVNTGISTDDWRECLEAGGAITFTVYADYLSRDVPEKIGRKVTANHCITLLEMKFNEDTDELEGVIVLDTGGWINNESGVGFIPAKKFYRMLKVTEYTSSVLMGRDED